MSPVSSSTKTGGLPLSGVSGVIPTNLSRIASLPGSGVPKWAMHSTVRRACGSVKTRTAVAGAFRCLSSMSAMPADDSDSQPEPVPDSQPPPAPVSDNDGPWHDGLSSAERQEHALRECLEGRSLTLLPDKPDTDALDVAATVDALRGERLTDFALVFRNAAVGRCLVASVKLILEYLVDECVSGVLVPPVCDRGC